MLADEQKLAIQRAYSQFLEGKGFEPRACQQQMIDEILGVLGGLDPEDPQGTANVCVVEAGTGTGKTIAYALATIPAAKALKKKVVISTATVALQEQVVYQDLPDIREHSGLEFSFALAKGRHRYLCLSRFNQALYGGADQNRSFDFGEDAASPNQADEQDREIYRDMAASLSSQRWDGDKDTWPQALNNTTWNRVTSNYLQCTNRHCPHYDSCYFYQARAAVHEADCIVANHDLVLVDLFSDSGVLPAPEQAIFVFDEGHHLPEKAAHHLSHSLSFQSTRQRLTKWPGRLERAAKDLNLEDISPEAGRQMQDISLMMDTAAQLLSQYQRAAGPLEEGTASYAFPQGLVPPEVAAIAADLALGCSKLSANLAGFEAKARDAILEDVGSRVQWQQEAKSAEPNSPNPAANAAGQNGSEAWASTLAEMVSQLAEGSGLWHSFSVASEPQEGPPDAKWITYTGKAAKDFEMKLFSCPVSVAEELADRLWQRSFGVIVTSATLAVAGDFTAFRRSAGLADSNRFVSLPSPFHFQEQGRLRVPRMRANPKQVHEHTREVTALLPKLLADDLGALVLFTSRRQMNQVHEGLDASFRQRVLLQGSLSKMEIVDRHRQAVDRGEPSCIFGLASFSEGVDFPGDYCTHVVIAKLPFAVPTDPVARTLEDWVNAQGGNFFQDFAVPETAIRTVQMAGRLLRTESDQGQVTVLDTRLVTTRYGTRILDALPPFKRELQ